MEGQEINNTITNLSDSNENIIDQAFLNAEQLAAATNDRILDSIKESFRPMVEEEVAKVIFEEKDEADKDEDSKEKKKKADDDEEVEETETKEKKKKDGDEEEVEEEIKDKKKDSDGDDVEENEEEKKKYDELDSDALGDMDEFDPEEEKEVEKDIADEDDTDEDIDLSDLEDDFDMDLDGDDDLETEDEEGKEHSKHHKDKIVSIDLGDEAEDKDNTNNDEDDEIEEALKLLEDDEFADEDDQEDLLDKTDVAHDKKENKMGAMKAELHESIRNNQRQINSARRSFKNESQVSRTNPSNLFAKRKIQALEEQNIKLQKTLDSLTKANKIMEAEMKDSTLFNQKEGFAKKLIKEYFSTSDKNIKLRVWKEFDKATNLQEAKTIFKEMKQIAESTKAAIKKNSGLKKNIELVNGKNINEEKKIDTKENVNATRGIIKEFAKYHNDSNLLADIPMINSPIEMSEEQTKLVSESWMRLAGLGKKED